MSDVEFAKELMKVSADTMADATGLYPEPVTSKSDSCHPGVTLPGLYQLS
jgi:hypothetical protein